MAVIFDSNGFITPATFIEVELNEFEHIFVNAFPASQTRRKIYDTFLAYLEMLKVCIGETPFYQWLNGSFVTQKLNPQDLDIVSFIPTEIYNQTNIKLREQKSMHSFVNIDDYFVELFPSDHRSYQLYLSDRVYWLHLFSYTKRNVRTDKRYEKGFIQINF